MEIGHYGLKRPFNVVLILFHFFDGLYIVLFLVSCYWHAIQFNLVPFQWAALQRDTRMRREAGGLLPAEVWVL